VKQCTGSGGWVGENPPYCEAERVVGREQRCPVLLGSAGSCLLYLAVKCWGLPGSAWGQLDLPTTQNLSSMVGLARETVRLGWLCDIC